ncbi:MAG TPA: hypothetical protein PLF85_11720 [Turneriella sp.]|nr:hypothetical protein [Turneriella sp.]
MQRFFLFVSLLSGATATAAAGKKIGSTKVHFVAELRGNDMHMTEEHALDLTEAWQYPSRTYYRSFLAGRFPWSQDLTDFHASVDGQPMKTDLYRYGYDKVMLRLPALAAGNYRLKISYTIRDIRGFPEATLPELRFWDYPLHIEEVTAQLTGLPRGAEFALIERYNREQFAQKRADGIQALAYGKDHDNTPSPVLLISSSALRYDEGIVGYMRYFAQQSRLLPFVGFLIILMLLLRFMPSRIVLGFISLYMFIPLAFWLSRIPGWLSYFAARKEIEPRAEYIEHFYGELAGDIAVAAILFLLALRVVRGIWRGEISDYYLPYGGLVSFLVLLLFMGQDPEALLMLPLAALFPLMYSGKQVTRFFGADAHLWIEKVISVGKMSFDELSLASGLAVTRLNRIFAALPTHPVAIDHDKRQYLSADALAALEQNQFCNNCGGTLKVEHSDLLQCPYCRSDYAVALGKKSKAKNTPPLVVSTLANFLKASGMMLMIVFVFLAAFGAITELYARLHRKGGTGGDWAVVITIAILGGAAYGGFAALATRLLSGKGYALVSAVLATLAPLVWPIFALRALMSPRSKFFFGQLDLARIREWLSEKKYIPLIEFARRLRASELDAMNLAHYLTSSGELDAVYDRRNNTLTERSLFRAKAGANSCQSCGGVVSVMNGARVCRYCGTKAT